MNILIPVTTVKNFKPQRPTADIFFTRNLCRFLYNLQKSREHFTAAQIFKHNDNMFEKFGWLVNLPKFYFSDTFLKFFNFMVIAGNIRISAV